MDKLPIYYYLLPFLYYAYPVFLSDICLNFIFYLLSPNSNYCCPYSQYVVVMSSIPVTICLKRNSMYFTVITTKASWESNKSLWGSSLHSGIPPPFLYRSYSVNHRCCHLMSSTGMMCPAWLLHSPPHLAPLTFWCFLHNFTES